VIHYHGTPCGATRQDVARFLSGRHALIPWGRHEDIGTAAEVCQSFCVDNGAFTAWKQGQAITNWTPYYAFVAFWQQHPAFDWAIIPDVIDGDEQENDLLLSQWPLSRNVGVPVWHLHESMRRLETLAGRYPRIALGSSGQWATPGTRDWWERINKAMEVLCDEEGRPKVKLHGLRMLDPAIFHRLPLASADSTNAVRNSSSFKRFGMYVPPNASTRMDIIAERIERHQSAAVWLPIDEQGVLSFDEQEAAS
jgi:hypothetical protein